MCIDCPLDLKIQFKYSDSTQCKFPGCVTNTVSEIGHTVHIIASHLIGISQKIQNRNFFIFIIDVIVIGCFIGHIGVKN